MSDELYLCKLKVGNVRQPLATEQFEHEDAVHQRYVTKCI